MAASTAWSTDPFIDFKDFAKNIAPMYTSFGDMTRLKIFEQFRPSAGNDVLVVEDLDYSNRFPYPGVPYSFFEYDGIFHLICHSGLKHATQEKMNLHVGLVKEWFDVVI